MKDQLQQVRRLVPASRFPAMVAAKVDTLWADEAFRAAQEHQMRHLLEHTERADEIPELARKYAEAQMMRRWLRWKPHLITHQEVRGVENVDRTRSVVLNFMHHNQYSGLFSSLDRVGIHCHLLALAEAMERTATVDIRQHMRIVTSRATVIPTTQGSKAVLAAMTPGVVMAIASDVPGQTEVEFLGQRVTGSFGAARIATLSDSPVVVATAVREGDSQHIQLHPPLEPSDFADPKDLLAEMLRIHGEAVLAWPEVFENPTTRFGALDG
ncbi:lauroyl/myristoyl acyltransferase [Nocardioides daedukensis]|uniref:Lauroyl/myristoyl acyltransferase n=1 Tax=Nocardioides daedukensis TaxID=634462 RepID=A0A7Y9URH1_9ACTN|nr:hypothetical protein [Nocardioides daedukensis]NYG59726.1 lauroyl/myristoyl acyltransferase [Nocardioides daedukensis]